MMRVYMTKAHTTISEKTGSKTLYHSGRAFHVGDALGAAMRKAGVCLLADEHNEPFRDPEEVAAAEPGPEPAATEAVAPDFPDADDYATDEPEPEPEE